MYTIEELEKTFLSHAKKAEQWNKKLLKEFKENNPGEPIPDDYIDDFSLSTALASICREIIEIKSITKEDDYDD